jgi:hypothetical protein
MKTGKPNYDGSQFKKKNHFKVKDVPVVARIIGPIPELSGDGVWNKYHAVVFGYKNSEGKHRVFESPLVTKDKGKTVVTPCAATARVNDFKAKLEQAIAENTNPKLVERLNVLVGQKGVYSIDKNFHMNVILLDGTIGELKIRSKHMASLKAEINKLRDDGIDPLSDDNGRFFEFSKSGYSRDTVFSVRVYKEKINATDERAVVHKMTPEIEARLDTEAFDLNNIQMKVTSEEVDQIVSESDVLTGKSLACNRIFDERWKAERQAKANQTQAPRTENKTVVKPLATYVDENPDMDDHEEADPTPVQAQTTKAAPVTPNITTSVTIPVTPKAQPATTQAQTIEELPDDEFFKMIGVPQQA